MLYVEGNLDNLNSNCIAIVGSRNYTEYGKKWCEAFTKELIQYDVTIVSGMAIGIDTIAHSTAIKTGGKTIAVLPSGLNNIYPERNKSLYKNILNNNGTVITEYESDIKATSYRFLERNRIVAGISIGIIVIEAAYRSGTSVTAKLAFEQKKDVYCIPGNLDSSKSMGTNNLIKNGAKLVTNPYDVINNYGFLKKKENDNINIKKAVDFDIKEEYRDIYKVINSIPMTIDEIAKACNTKQSETMSKLTMLEIEGKIKRISGNRFIKKEE